MQPINQDNTVFSISDLNAQIHFEQLKHQLKPPPRFEHASLSNYITDSRFPSQERAKITLQDFIHSLNQSSISRSLWHRLLKNPMKLLKGIRSSFQQSIYLDGVFGVGKTHLLAAVFHAFPFKNKIYLSFTELVYFIGLLGLDRCAREMSICKLICIDEFELDDPGNTTMSLGFLTRVMQAGCAIITTSNTPPMKLGEGRFDVRNFQREIGEMSKRFLTIQIDGNDYRKKIINNKTKSLEHHNRNTWQVKDLKPLFEGFEANLTKKKLYLTREGLFELLRQYHPMHYFELASKLSAVFIEGIDTINDQFDALRFVYFIDKLYDNKVQLYASTQIEIDALFAVEFYKSSYTKKYWRCISRLKEMCG